MTRESLWLSVDADDLRALERLARARQITLHDAARVALRLGLELVARPAPPQPRQPALPWVHR
jgi:hypothetical protein